MTTYLSYQHAEVNSASNGDLATDTSIDINNKNNKSSNNNNRIVRSMMVVGVVFLMAIANEALSTSNNDANTAQGMMLRPKRVPLASFSSKNDDDYHDYGTDDQYPYDNATKPDYNGEGKYDWQKCQDSSDPDCWKNEGERVGSYWDNFGQRTGAYWTSFGDAIKNFFTFGSKAKEPKPLLPPPPPTSATGDEEKETTPVLEDDDDDMISATVEEEKGTTPILEEDDDDMISASVVEEKETSPTLEEDENDAAVDTNSSTVTQTLSMH